MESLLAQGFRLPRLRTLSRVCATAAVVAAAFIVLGVPQHVASDDGSTLTVTPSYAGEGDTVTVTVVDAARGVTNLQADEEIGFTDNSYLLPPGDPGTQEVFRVRNSPVGDSNGDKQVTAADIALSISEASVSWVNPATGVFSVSRTTGNLSSLPFKVTYRSEQVDTAVVDVSSTADPEGFQLTLKETSHISNQFEATFRLGEETSDLNASDPDGTARPVIEALDEGVVTVEYADTTPENLLTDAVLVDDVNPIVIVQTPGHESFTRNVTEWAVVEVTDRGAGVELSDILFHVDVDGDGVFDEAGETVPASAADSQEINNGWLAVVLLPRIPEQGPVNWFVTAEDRAGNIGRSDAEDESGLQNHMYVLDTTPPTPVEVTMGDSYDPKEEEGEEGEELDNQQNRIKVEFSEPIDPDSISASRFVFGNMPAIEAVSYEEIPEIVWLTYHDLPTVAEDMYILAGAVIDRSGFASELLRITPVDKLGPIMDVTVDKAVTAKLVTVTARSDEHLAGPPSVSVNGVTQAKLVQDDIRTWSIVLDASAFTGSAAGDGVKNVELTGFDRRGNVARGGVSVESADYPEQAVRFQLDRVIKSPSVLPTHHETTLVANPRIVASYATEADEYPGDTHDSVTVIGARLNGQDITPDLEATTPTSWSYQAPVLEKGSHTFTIQARDSAGNVHPVTTVVFQVGVDPPTPTPAPTLEPTPTPVPTIEPGTGDPSDPEPTATAVPNPGPTETPDETDPEPTPTPTPDDEDPTPVPTTGADNEDFVDVEATVQAIRAEEERRRQEEEDNPPFVAAEPAFTVYGCGFPASEGGSAGSDYVLAGMGMLGLAVLARRRRYP